MIQLYILSILCNGLSGYILFAGNDGDIGENFKVPLSNPTFNLVLGIMCTVTGFLKLLSPMKYAIFGDFLPAIAGIVAGLILIFGIYRKNASYNPANENSLENIGTNLLRFRKPLGIGLIASALLHFLFPEALFL